MRIRQALHLTLCLLVASCTTPVEDDSAGELARATAFWKPHLRHLSASSPYTKLHVEIDALEGSIPDPGDLEALRDFLTTHAGRPGGVTVALDDQIPLEVARDRMAASLGLEFVDGPPDESTAFLYALYYDSKKTADEKSNPHLTLIPYPSSIFIDEHYGKTVPREFLKLAILHEAGHALGLSRNTEHGDGLHCTNQDCLMNAQIALHVSRLLTFRDPWKQRTPCPSCLADLAVGRKEKHETRTTQIGAYVARSETGYHVLSLPGFAYVQVGELAEIDWDHVEGKRKAGIAKLSGDTVVTMYSNEMDLGVAKGILPRLKADPYKAVRDLADNLQEQLEAIDRDSGDPSG